MELQFVFPWEENLKRILYNFIDLGYDLATNVYLRRIEEELESIANRNQYLTTG